MAKYKRNNTIITIVAVILVLLLLGGAAGLIWRYKDTIKGWFGGTDKAAIEVTFGEKTYTKDGGGLMLAPGDKFTVKLSENGIDAETLEGLKVTVTAREGANFTYKVGEEPYTWADAAGRDFTKGFTVTASGDTLTFNYGTFADILSKCYPQNGDGTAPEITVDAGQSFEGDLFTLTLEWKEHKISLGFSVKGLPLTDITVQPDHVEFGG